MTQGIFIHGRRPKSKAEIKRLIQEPDFDPAQVFIEATSIFGNEYDGSLFNAPAGKYTFVGPDPYTSRKFYGNITVKESPSGREYKVT